MTIIFICSISIDLCILYSNLKKTLLDQAIRLVASRKFRILLKH